MLISSKGTFRMEDIIDRVILSQNQFFNYQLTAIYGIFFSFSVIDFVTALTACEDMQNKLQFSKKKEAISVAVERLCD